MKTIRYRSLAIFLGLLICWLIPSIIDASVQVDGIYYELNTSNMTAEVDYNPDNYSGTVDIPASFVYNSNTFCVTSIGEMAFTGCTALSSVGFPTSLTSIGEMAFAGCTSLSSVRLPNSLISIGLGAFDGCTGLTSVEIPNNVTRIGEYAFSGCSGMNSVTIPNSLTVIKPYTFRDCTSLTSVIIPNSVTDICGGAFSGCTGLTSIRMETESPPAREVTLFTNVDKANCTLYVPYGSKLEYESTYPWCEFQNVVEYFYAGDLDVLATVTCGDEVHYTIYSDMTMVISGTDKMWDYDSSLEYFCDYKSDYYEAIKNLYIEEGVTGIAKNAFDGCTSLISVRLPNSLTSIGNRAFSGCTALTSMEIPNNVTRIGEYAFEYCSGLNSVTISNNLEVIMPYTFRDCTSLSSVIIPNSVTDICGEAFSGCTGLTSITVETKMPSATELGCFSNVDKTNCTLYVPFGSKPDYQSAYPWNEFQSIVEYFYVGDLDVLATVTCGDEVHYTIYSDMTMVISGTDTMWDYDSSWQYFYDYKSDYYEAIKNLFIEDGVTGIAKNAFDGCTSLTSVRLPSSLTSIGNRAFFGCTALNSVEIPNSVTRIGEYAFSGCSGMSSVTIPNSVTYIGENAFSGCSGLNSVTIPNDLEVIRSYTFRDCTSLSSVIIPNSVTDICREAFSGCTGLASITVETAIPPVPELGCFSNVDKTNCTLYVPFGSKLDYLATISWSEFNIKEYFNADGLDVLATGSCGDNVSFTLYSDMTLVISGTGAMENYPLLDTEYYQIIENVIIEEGVTSICAQACYKYKSLVSVTIPNSVTSIGNNAFNQCYSLTSVTIPSNVTSIGSNAFTECISLTSVDIPNSVTSIGNSAFQGCGINSVSIPNSVSSIGNYAFSICNKLLSVTIPGSVTSIGDYAFMGCSGLTSATILNGVTSIGSETFSGCDHLTTVTIPKSMTSIGCSAFFKCESLSSVNISDLAAWYSINFTNEWSNPLLYANHLFLNDEEINDLVIPDNVTSVNNYAFIGCDGLISVTIPGSVNLIGDAAFEGCSNLSSIKVESIIPVGIYPDSFVGVDYSSCTLFVPAGSKTAYENAEVWNEFQTIVEYTPGQKVLATGSCGDNVIYILFDDMTMVISGTGAMTNFTINYDDDTINRENNEYWTQAKTVTIEEGVTSIGNYAFSNCPELTSVSIPNSVTSIGTSAFLGCEALTSITIPASVETIGADALSYTGLTHIYIEDCDDVLQFEQVTLYMEDYEDPLEYVYLGRNITTIDFHEYNPWEGVEGYPPFSRSRNLHTLEIGDKVTYLEDWSFSSAPLQSLVIGSNVQSIGTRALSSANEGQTLVVPSNVKRMGDYSLSPSITTLVLEKGSDDLELFAGYNSLELSFYGSESSIDSIYVGRNLTCGSNTNIHVVCRSACFDASLHRTMNTSGEEEEFDLTDYYIPPVCATKYYFGSGASVGEYYFQNSPVEHVYNLRSSRVGNFAFFDSNVKTVSFDAEGSTTIGNSVFSGCDGLTTLSFPEGMTDIGDNAFMDCYGLTSITIPSSLKSIGGNCFFMDDTERNVSFNVYISDLSAWCSMDIGWGGSPLIWGHLIYNGGEVTDLVVPEDVQSIGMGAFDSYSSLTSVLIPESVTSIGDRAFYCTGLTSVTMESAVPLTIDGSTFEGVDKTNCILYVPAGSKSAYVNADYWSEFEHIVEYGEEPDTDISALDNAIYVEQTEGRIGGTKDISVKMKNDFDVRGFQFTMELPEGATIHSWTLNQGRMPAGTTMNKVFATEGIDENVINVVCALNDGQKTFTGNDGLIATVNVTFAEDMEEGTYPIYLTNNSISDATAEYQLELSDIKSTLVLEDYVVGDTNGDGKVLVGDVIAILNYIVGSPSNNFNTKAADVNGDGKILVGDVIAVLNIIVNQ